MWHAAAITCGTILQFGLVKGWFLYQECAGIWIPQLIVAARDDGLCVTVVTRPRFQWGGSGGGGLEIMLLSIAIFDAV